MIADLHDERLAPRPVSRLVHHTCEGQRRFRRSRIPVHIPDRNDTSFELQPVVFSLRRIDGCLGFSRRRSLRACHAEQQGPEDFPHDHLGGGGPLMLAR